MKRLAATVAKRIAHGARIPPALSRYRIVPTIDPLEYAADMATGQFRNCSQRTKAELVYPSMCAPGQIYLKTEDDGEGPFMT